MPHHGAAQRSAMCSSAARAVGSTLWLLTFGPPCAAVRGGRSGPQGNRQGCRFLFAGAGAPSKSPAAPHELAGRAGQRQVGVPFLLALPPSRWLLSLGQARESDPASGRRSEARGRRARSPYHHNPRPRAKSLDPCLRRGDGAFVVTRQEWPLTAMKMAMPPLGRGSQEPAASRTTPPQNSPNFSGIKSSTACANTSGWNFATKRSAFTSRTIASLKMPLIELCNTTFNDRSDGVSRIARVNA